MVSPVWNLFPNRKISEKKASCSICHVWISYKSNTSALISHAATVHGISYAKLKEIQLEKHMDSLKSQPSSEKRIRKLQAKAFISTGMSFRSIENREFREFLGALNNNFKPVTGDTIRSDVIKMDQKLIFCDPRFVYSKVFSLKDWDEIEYTILEEHSDTETSTSKPVQKTPVSKCSADHLSMEYFLSGNSSTTDDAPESDRQRIKKEISLYRKDANESRIAAHSNPIEYWYSKKNAFPILSALAISMIGVPASSASTERIFSNASRLVSNKLRNRLSASTCSSILLTQAKIGYDRKHVVTPENDAESDSDEEIEHCQNNIQEDPRLSDSDFDEMDTSQDINDFFNS